MHQNFTGGATGGGRLKLWSGRNVQSRESSEKFIFLLHQREIGGCLYFWKEIVPLRVTFLMLILLPSIVVLLLLCLVDFSFYSLGQTKCLRQPKITYAEGKSSLCNSGWLEIITAVETNLVSRLRTCVMIMLEAGVVTKIPTPRFYSVLFCLFV